MSESNSLISDHHVKQIFLRLINIPTPLGIMSKKCYITQHNRQQQGHIRCHRSLTGMQPHLQSVPPTLRVLFMWAANTCLGADVNQIMYYYTYMYMPVSYNSIYHLLCYKESFSLRFTFIVRSLRLLLVYNRHQRDSELYTTNKTPWTKSIMNEN